MTQKDLNQFIGTLELCLEDLKTIYATAEKTGKKIEDVVVPGRFSEDWRIDCVADVLSLTAKEILDCCS